MAFTYTGENVQERPAFKLAPEGKYNVKIIKGEEKISKSGKNMIVLTVQIVHPEYKNQMFEYIVDNEHAQQRIFDILTSCGVTPTRGMSINAQTFVNRTGRVKVKHEEYNGEKQLRISFWEKTEATPAPARGIDPSFAPGGHNTDGIPF